MEEPIALCPICGDTIDWCPECRSFGIWGLNRRRIPQEIGESRESLGVAELSGCLTELKKSLPSTPGINRRVINY